MVWTRHSPLPLYCISLILLPRSVDALIDRAVAAWDSCDEINTVDGCLIERFSGKDSTVGDIYGRLISVDPVVQFLDKFGVPGFVGSVSAEDVSDDGNAGSVDTEACLELLEVTSIVSAVAVSEVERGVFFVFVLFVEALDGERGGIGVNDVVRELFVGSSTEKDGRKDRFFSGLGEFIEGSPTRMVVEVIWFNSFPKQVLNVSPVKELRQPLHRLPFS